MNFFDDEAIETAVVMFINTQGGDKVSMRAALHAALESLEERGMARTGLANNYGCCDHWIAGEEGGGAEFVKHEIEYWTERQFPVIMIRGNNE